eukprot:TRINITY_DN10947_c0_g1_i1.p1 TRINITY_DN10947_c0_g1~~TRINITY_DN10947_c0_g1_i1.p1  ORF type:complete len:525 (-),score=54.37 TRINITY_DN10947_c0_g1_i1:6-1580(-)
MAAPFSVVPNVTEARGHLVVLTWPQVLQFSLPDSTVSVDIFAYRVFLRWKDEEENWSPWRFSNRTKQMERPLAVVNGLRPGVTYQFALQAQSTTGFTSEMTEPITHYVDPTVGRQKRKLRETDTEIGWDKLSVHPEESVYTDLLASSSGHIPYESALGAPLLGLVPMGLEAFSQAELAELLPNAKVTILPGHVAVHACAKELPLARSVDTWFAFVWAGAEVLPHGKEEALKRLEALPMECEWDMAIQLWRTNNSKPADYSPTFRVTCSRMGDHPFRSPEACLAFGGAIFDRFGWKVNLDHPEMEVYLRIAHNDVIAGVRLSAPATGEQARRGHMKTMRKAHSVESLGSTTLRTSIANALAVSAFKGEKPFLICDPMAGTGSVCIEGYLNVAKHALWLAGDNCPVAVNTALQNSVSAQHGVDVVLWDATHLPLRKGVIDALVTDMPFGRRHGSHDQNLRLYPALLREWARVCREGARVTLLTTEYVLLVKILEQIEGLWALISSTPILMGGIRCTICYLQRSPGT